MDYREWKLYERELCLDIIELKREADKADDEFLREERIKSREEIKKDLETYTKYQENMDLLLK